MIKISSGILTGGLILGTVAMTYAEPYTWREAHQHARVSQGVHSGEITPCELWNLEREQVSIETFWRRAWSDGRLSPWEARYLTWEQNRASRHLREAKYNADHAW